MSEKVLLPFDNFDHLSHALEGLLTMVSQPAELTLLYVETAASEDDRSAVDLEDRCAALEAEQRCLEAYSTTLAVLNPAASPYEAILHYADAHEMHTVLFTNAFLSHMSTSRSAHSAAAVRRDGQNVTA